jgi:A/G-specific adenine glycosylase
LAEAAESDVLALWSGLGYYRRARALHAAAKLVCLHYGGSFPNRTSGLRDLPGVGRYTAAAVASIAFNAPVAVVDGNVERVLARMFGNRPLDCWSIAGSLLCRARAGDFNQALMELGATVCLPRGPQCAACPVRCWCRTQGAGTRSQVRKRQRRQVHYRLARRREKVFLVTRPPTASIMPGMWELPELPLDTAVSSLTLRHSITVTDYDVHVSCGEPPRSSQGTWVAAADVLQLPLTGLTRKILRRARVIQ